MNFSINGIGAIEPASVWYHHKRQISPTAQQYQVRIKVSDKELVEQIEMLVGSKQDDPTFESSIMDRFQSSHCSLILYLVHLSAEHNQGQRGKDGDIEWVFQNITSVEVTNHEILVSGMAEPFLEQ